MDADYLKKTVGDALSEGMARVVAQQPADAVDFLGRFLVNFANVKEQELEAAKAKAKQEQEVAIQLELRLQQQKLAEEARKQEEALAKARADIINGLKTSDKVDISYIKNVITYLQDAIGATAVYVARRDTIEGAAPLVEVNDDGEEVEVSNIILKYLAVSPQSQDFILNQSLRENEGITHQVFKKPEPEEEEDEEEDPENPKPPKPVPKAGLFVDNVLGTANVKYFATPKLGSYFAVDIPVESYLHGDNQTEDIIGMYKSWLEAKEKRAEEEAERQAEKARIAEEKRLAKEEREKELQAAREAAAEAGEEFEEPEEPPEEEEQPDEPLPPIEDPKFIKKQNQYVLCVDTLGQGLNKFSEEALDFIRKIAEHLKSAISRSELASLYAEMDMIVAEEQKNASDAEAMEARAREEEEALQQKLEEMQKELEEKAKEAEEAGVELPIEEDAALRAAQIKLDAAQRAVLAMKSKIAELQRYRLAPKGKSMNVLKCALYTLSYKREDVRDAQTNKTDWAKMKMNFNNDFFTKLQAYDPAATVADEGKLKKSKKNKGKKVQKIPKYRQTEALKKLVDGVEVADINAKSVAVGALLEWCNQVLDVREKAKIKLEKEAAIEAERIKREEEEAARLAKEAEEKAAEEANTEEAAEE